MKIQKRGIKLRWGKRMVSLQVQIDHSSKGCEERNMLSGKFGGDVPKAGNLAHTQDGEKHDNLGDYNYSV